MRTGSAVLQVAAPLMRAVAEKLRINVGLAVADRYEMVYLESIRYNRQASLRNVVSGQRVPIELTSLGRAWLAVAPEARRAELLKEFEARRGDWPRLRKEIDKAVESVRRRGWCAASWQPEIVALATPLVLENERVHVLNASVSTTEPANDVALELSAPLLALAEQIGAAVPGYAVCQMSSCERLARRFELRDGELAVDLLGLEADLVAGLDLVQHGLVLHLEDHRHAGHVEVLQRAVLERELPGCPCRPCGPRLRRVRRHGGCCDCGDRRRLRATVRRVVCENTAVMDVLVMSACEMREASQWPAWPLAGLRTWTSMFLAGMFCAGMAAAPGAARSRRLGQPVRRTRRRPCPGGCLNQPGFA